MTPMSQSSSKVSAYQLLPPYQEAEPLDVSLQYNVGRGALVAVRPHYSSTWSDVSSSLRAARYNFPAAPVILWADCIGAERAANWGRLIRDHGARAVIGSVLDPISLRRQLTSKHGLAAVVMVWIRSRTTISGDAEMLLRFLAERAPDHRCVQQAVVGSGLSVSAWRRHFSKAQVGPLHSWFQLLHTLPVCLQLQESTGRSVADVAVECGYYDAAALRRRCGELLGAAPGQIRTLIGWEPFFYHGCRRAGFSRRSLPSSGGTRPRKTAARLTFSTCFRSDILPVEDERTGSGGPQVRSDPKTPQALRGKSLLGE